MPPKINLKQPNAIFKFQVRCFVKYTKDCLSQGNLLALQDMQRFAGATVDWTYAGAGPNLLSYMTRSAHEINERKKKLIADGINPSAVALVGKNGISLAKLKKEFGPKLSFEIIQDLADEGFLVIHNPTSKDPFEIHVALSPIWNYYMNNFQMAGEERDTYIESIGKIVTIGVLAKKSIESPQPLSKGGIPCGVGAFIALFTIIQEASMNGRMISREKCEEIYAKSTSGARFSRIISHDNARTDNQRIFEKTTGVNIEVKQEVINAYRILQTMSNNLYNSVQAGGQI